MKSRRLSFPVTGIFILLLTILTIQPAWSQVLKPLDDGFPNQPIQLLSFLGPGSGTDAYLRAIAGAAKPLSPVPVVVQNIVNPKGLWGHLVYISQQKGGNEGYFLSTIAGGNTLRAIRLDTRPYTIKDLKGVITTHSDTVVLVVKKDAKWKTLKELLDDARVNPGKIRVVAGGPASGADYIVITLLEAAAGVKFTKVPSGGSGKGTLVLLGGGSEAASLSISGPAAYLKSGELRGIGIAMPTKERDAAWPDIPTYKEQGIDVGFPFANGLAVPKEVPDSHVKWLSELFKRAAHTEAFKKYVNAKGLSVHLRFLKETEQDMQAAINILEPILDEMGMKFKP